MEYIGFVVGAILTGVPGGVLLSAHALLSKIAGSREPREFHEFRETLLGVKLALPTFVVGVTILVFSLVRLLNRFID